MRKKTNLSDLMAIDPEYDILMLNVMLSDPTFLNKVRGTIDRHLFDNPQLSIIMGIIAQTDVTSWEDLEFAVKQEFGENNVHGQQVLDSLPELKLEHLGNTQIHKNNIVALFQQKKIKKVLDKIYKKDKANIPIQADDVIELTNIFKELPEHTIDEFTNDAGDFFKEDAERVSVGVHCLDVVFEGRGISPRDLMLYIIPTGGGKTSLLGLASTAALLEGKKVLHIYVEDESINVKRKYVTAFTGIPLSDINENTELVKIKMDKYMPFLKNLMSVSSNGENITIAQIEDYIEDFLEKHLTMDRLVLDYLDRIVLGKGRLGLYDEQAEVMRQLNRIAKKYNINIITASQSNRGGGRKDVIYLDDIQGSIVRTQIATHIVTVGLTPEMMKMNAATFHVAKARENGAAGTMFVNMLWDPNRLIADASETIVLNEGF
jgi:replicative DNA helicase